MNEVIVSMNNISKSFPGVKALDHVKFELRSGEVMALLGRKWCRKIYTLMKILSGVYTRDEGTMEIFGKSCDNLTPKQAQAGWSCYYPPGIEYVPSPNGNGKYVPWKRE